MSGTVGLNLPTSSAGRLTFEQWARLGRQLGTLVARGPWAAGDWCRYGAHYERPYGHRYTEALAATGLDYGTLRNYAVVAGRFPLGRRHGRLTFSHHEVLAALDDKAQDAWLDRAERERWNVAQLRARLRDSRKASNSRPAVERVESVRVRLEPERRQRWQAAATAAGLELEKWLTAVADEAAAAELAPLDAPGPALVAVA